MNIKHLLTFAHCLTLTLFVSTTSAQAKSTESIKPVESGQLQLSVQPQKQHKEGKQLPAKKIKSLLLSTKADIHANAISTSVTLTQVFKNPSKEWVQGIYVFPLPKNAAVDSMKMIIGDKKIVGKIRQKKKAQELYTAAIENGQKAALVEHMSSELFSAKAGNIPPESEIEIVIHYVQPTHYDAGVFSLSVPTTYTPKYLITNDDDNPKKIIEESTNHPAQTNTLEGTNVFSHSAQHNFVISVSLDAGIALKSIHSPSHNISKDINNHKAIITFTQEHVSMDKDFHIQWETEKSISPLAVAFTEKTHDAYYTSLLVIPPEMKSVYQQPREVIFIIDRSGSMAGTSMNQAKSGALAALQHLREKDTFNIIEFDDNYSTLFKNPQIASEKKHS